MWIETDASNNKPTLRSKIKSHPESIKEQWSWQRN